MAKNVAQPWILGADSAIPAAIKKLRDSGQREEVLFLIFGDACAARFDAVATVLSALSNLSKEGVQILLQEPVHDSHAMEYVFAASGFPDLLFPLFASIIDTAREAASVRKGPLGPKAQSFVLEKAIKSPRVKIADLPEGLMERFVTSYSETL